MGEAETSVSLVLDSIEVRAVVVGHLEMELIDGRIKSVDLLVSLS